jgi:hypothetical protein
MKQIEILNVILRNMPYVGHGALTSKEVEEILAAKGYPESNRNVRRKLAYLCDENKIKIVITEGQRRMYARLKPAETNMTFTQALVIKNLKASVIAQFPTSVQKELASWFEKADKTVEKLAKVEPSHPLLMYVATEKVELTVLHAANDACIQSIVATMEATNDAIYEKKELRLCLEGGEYERHVKPRAIEYRDGVAYLEGNFLDNPGQLASIPLKSVQAIECVDYLEFASPSRLPRAS